MTPTPPVRELDLDDLILISIDDHVVEPPTLFDAHIPDKYREQAPKVVRTSDGDDVWVYNDTVIPNIGLNAVANPTLPVTTSSAARTPSASTRRAGPSCPPC